MLAAATAMSLLADSAAAGEIAQPALVATLELMRRVSLPPMSAFGLWFVACYAAGFAPDHARHWLATAERIALSLDSPLWPESCLRDETMAVLGITDLSSIIEQTLPTDPKVALEEAAAWLAARDVTEYGPRTVIAPDRMARTTV
jgi:hypothetical protein